MKKISVVSPVYNEGVHIFRFIEAVQDVFASLPYELELVLIDDGSADDSWQQLRVAAEKYPFVRGLRLSKNFGKEAALAAGLSVAHGDGVITLDSDLQHPPSLIPSLLEKWEQGAEIVVAVKEERQKESKLNRFLATLYYKIFRWVSETDIHNASDYILLDKKVADTLRALPEKVFFYRGVAHWIGFDRATVPFMPASREHGVSGWSFLKKIRLAIDSLSGFTAKPLSLIWLMGILFFIFAVIIGGEALITKIRGESVTGFTTVILLVLTTGTAVLASICLLSVYIRQIFHEVKARPRFIISNRVSGEDEKTQGEEEGKKDEAKL